MLSTETGIYLFLISMCNIFKKCDDFDRSCKKLIYFYFYIDFII